MKNCPIFPCKNTPVDYCIQNCIDLAFTRRHSLQHCNKSMQHASLEASSLPTTMHPSTTNCKHSASRASNSKLVETRASCSLRPLAASIATTNNTNNTNAAHNVYCLQPVGHSMVCKSHSDPLRLRIEISGQIISSHHKTCRRVTQWSPWKSNTYHMFYNVLPQKQESFLIPGTLETTFGFRDLVVLQKPVGRHNSVHAANKPRLFQSLSSWISRTKPQNIAIQRSRHDGHPRLWMYKTNNTSGPRPASRLNTWICGYMGSWKHVNSRYQYSKCLCISEYVFASPMVSHCI